VRLGGSGTRWWRSFQVLGQAGGRPSNWLRALARFENPGGTSSRMSHFSAAKRRPRMSMRWRRAAWRERDAVVAELSSLGSSRRSTLQLVARGSAIRKPGRDIVLACPIFQPRSGVPAASALGHTTRDAASRDRRAASGAFGGAPRPGRREE
jgi:hypothetical protein